MVGQATNCRSSRILAKHKQSHDPIPEDMRKAIKDDDPLDMVCNVKHVYLMILVVM